MRFKQLQLLIFVGVLSVVSNERIINTKRSDTRNDIVETDGKIEKPINCTCVPYYQCSEDSGRVITDGDGLLDLRGLDDNTCTGYFDVCCNVTVTPSAKTPTHSKATISQLQEPEKGCGFLKQMLVPWSGILLVHMPSGKSSKWDYKCGVSIIHPRLALTAAHCLANNEKLAHPSQYKVKVADYISQVVKIIEHPEYNPSTLQNDAALLTLQDALTHVGTICIPPPSSQLVASQCTVTTWKKNGRLRIIEVPVVQHHKCEKMLRKTRLGKYFQLHTSFICAGGNSFQDACDGDGGSPLICPVPGQPGRYHQVGIVSWGIGCGERDTPGVYVNVAAFRNWIDEVVQLEIGQGTDGINSYRY